METVVYEDPPMGLIIFAIAVGVLMIAAFWRIYTKAGQPGWAAIVPIYNLYILTKIIGKPGYWTILLLIPYLSIIWQIWSYNLLAKKFGKSEGFTVGLVFLGFIFFPILAWGDARYQGDIPKEGSENVLDA